MHSLRRLRPQQLGALRRVLRRDAVTLAKGVAITMPALSPTMATGKIARWSKAEGDKLGSGDVLAEIETDKVRVVVGCARLAVCEVLARLITRRTPRRRLTFSSKTTTFSSPASCYPRARRRTWVCRSLWWWMM